MREAFVKHAGYNGWAEANNIILLYPQTVSSDWNPANPQGCWDWSASRFSSFPLSSDQVGLYQRGVRDQDGPADSVHPQPRAALLTAPVSAFCQTVKLVLCVGVLGSERFPVRPQRFVDLVGRSATGAPGRPVDESHRAMVELRGGVMRI